MSRQYITILLFISLFFDTSNSHSWLACTDYVTNGAIDAASIGHFDRDKCRGYPRGFRVQYEREKATHWGVDTGYDWRVKKCRYSYSPGDYSAMIPMATYKSQQVIHLSHPAKNHVADTCTNAFIPDRTLKLYLSINGDNFQSEVPFVGNKHQSGTIDHNGYQNCYKFCDDMENSHCVTSWRLPEFKKTTQVSFLWEWEFNVNEFYYTCFDAIITTDQPPVTTSKPLIATSSKPVITDQPSVASSKPSVASSKPSVASSKPLVATRCPRHHKYLNHTGKHITIKISSVNESNVTITFD